jgi:hypothetical protein
LQDRVRGFAASLSLARDLALRYIHGHVLRGSENKVYENYEIDETSQEMTTSFISHRMQDQIAGVKASEGLFTIFHKMESTYRLMKSGSS